MKREIIKTADGSSTIFLPEWNEHYHSKHGAVQEALHVFIKAGLIHFCERYNPANVSILEIGFGTGLNVLLTLLEVRKMGVSAEYLGVEAFPVSSEELQLLDYTSTLDEEIASEAFEKIHSTKWENSYKIFGFFHLNKQKKHFAEIEDRDSFDLIYFDAFGARVQPELWTEEIFRKMFEALKKGGILVTYSAKGSVRRALQAVGFIVERLPGPPGKREMLRATKSL